MKTINDLIGFLSKLDRDYPIPYINEVSDVEVENIKYYSLTWTEPMFTGDSVDCTFYMSWDLDLDDTKVSVVEIITKDRKYYESTLEDSVSRLNECLRKLYKTLY
jgi:hypothetical protein